MSVMRLSASRTKWIGLIGGFGCIGFGVAQMVHFVISAAQAGFPALMLTAPWNWLFVAIHTVLCVGGLWLVGWGRRKWDEHKKSPAPPISSTVTSPAPTQQGADEETQTDPQ